LLVEVAKPPAVEAFKAELLERCAYGPAALGRLVDLAGERYPEARVSERIALCEQAVWELLHEGSLSLMRSGALVERTDWQGVLLRWEAWTGEAVTIET
jgi:hypothetical protein